MRRRRRVEPPPSRASLGIKAKRHLLLTDDQDVVMGSLDYMPILKKLLMEKRHHLQQRLCSLADMLPVSYEHSKRSIFAKLEWRQSSK